jgi:hypothetical protein
MSLSGRKRRGPKVQRLRLVAEFTELTLGPVCAESYALEIREPLPCHLNHDGGNVGVHVSTSHEYHFICHHVKFPYQLRSAFNR